MTDDERADVFGGATDDLDAAFNEYVHFDEREDVLSSLELLTVVVPLVGQRPQLWKWVVIAAQSALQGAMVCALVDSTGTSVLTKKSALSMLNFLQDHSERSDVPREELERFEPLPKKCETELGLAVDAKEREDILRLHSHFRNSFIHFTPKGWGIEKAGLPRIVGAAMNVLEMLMAMDVMGVRLEESQAVRLRSSLAGIRSSLIPMALIIDCCPCSCGD
jgi:hypothetical protein